MAIGINGFVGLDVCMCVCVCVRAYCILLYIYQCVCVCVFVHGVCVLVAAKAWSSVPKDRVLGGAEQGGEARGEGWVRGQRSDGDRRRLLAAGVTGSLRGRRGAGVVKHRTVHIWYSIGQTSTAPTSLIHHVIRERHH